MRKALFLDRDGVINVDSGYVSRIDDFSLVDGIIPVLREAQAQGLLIIVVTNQSGIARGLFDEAAYAAIEKHMIDVLQEQGITVSAVYHCPHHPDGSVELYSRACDCRKPAPGMLLRAAAQHDLDLPASILIGDKQSDVDAAAAAGVGRAFLVDPGCGTAMFEGIREALASHEGPLAAAITHSQQ